MLLNCNMLLVSIPVSVTGPLHLPGLVQLTIFIKLMTINSMEVAMRLFHGKLVNFMSTSSGQLLSVDTSEVT